jgi:hypothetical protein
VIAGEIGPHTFSFDWPGGSKGDCSFGVPGGGCADRSGKSLGNRTWGERSGQLVRAPSYPYGGLFGSHLIFRWHEEGREYVLSLHAWEPVEETKAALRKTVLSIP